MQIQHSEVAPQTLNVKITISPEDYVPSVNTEIKKLKNKVSIKGFRKGKTPESTVRKMYGPQVMVDVVNKLVEKSLSDFLAEGKYKTIASPYAADDQPEIDFSLQNPSDLTFSFDVGHIADIVPQGVSEGDSIRKYLVTIDDKMIEEELDNIAKRNGQQVEVEDTVQLDDIILIVAEEHGDGVKDAWQTDFEVMVKDITDDYQSLVLGQKSGFEFEFDIYKLEKNSTEERVNKYLLQLDEDRDIVPTFKGKIKAVKRHESAELTEEVLTKSFGPEVTTVEQAREMIKKSLADHFDQQSTNVMYRDMMETIMEKTEVKLPAEFIKKSILLNDDKVTEEKVNEELDDILNNIKWNHILDTLTQQEKVQVEYQQIRDRMARNVM